MSYVFTSVSGCVVGCYKNRDAQRSAARWVDTEISNLAERNGLSAMLALMVT
jgi:hypothetical protein